MSSTKIPDFRAQGRHIADLIRLNSGRIPGSDGHAYHSDIIAQSLERIYREGQSSRAATVEWPTALEAQAAHAAWSDGKWHYSLTAWEAACKWLREFVENIMPRSTTKAQWPDTKEQYHAYMQSDYKEDVFKLWEEACEWQRDFIERQAPKSAAADEDLLDVCEYALGCIEGTVRDCADELPKKLRAAVSKARKAERKAIESGATKIDLQVRDCQYTAELEQKIEIARAALEKADEAIRYVKIMVTDTGKYECVALDDFNEDFEFAETAIKEALSRMGRETMEGKCS